MEVLTNQNRTLLVKIADLNQEIEIKNNVIARLEAENKQFQELKWAHH